jgi:hypothetical protein
MNHLFHANFQATKNMGAIDPGDKVERGRETIHYLCKGPCDDVTKVT